MTRVNVASKLDVRAMAADFEALKKSLVKGDTSVVALGTVLGRVSALAISNNPQDDSKPAIALVGEFQGVPTDTNVAPINATRAFIQPSSIHDMIVKRCLNGKPLPVTEMPKRGRPISVPLDGVLEFSCEVGIKYSDGSVGYTYHGEVDLPDGYIDPFADMKQRLALPVGSTARALPAPSKKSSKSKKK
jgi:hypothetical protein